MHLAAPALLPSPAEPCFGVSTLLLDRSLGQESIELWMLPSLEDGTHGIQIALGWKGTSKGIVDNASALSRDTSS